ncbi:hypothetical protein A6E15_02985 [Natrinema saccharevitans]|uniref:Uncharacterized protein n=1 Tax=Natrinema saccharevitans TaxID=301967 RepID=A0A1S8ATT5_9EURY|nr:hypothetical protein A6E15_02985 [Natrinema saccharevitans]
MRSATGSRRQYEDRLRIDADRRFETVLLGRTDHVLETATLEAATGRSERGGHGGPAELTDYGRDSIGSPSVDFRKGLIDLETPPADGVGHSHKRDGGGRRP